jgi:uncharacterized membrane protein YgaE (UPF0421/DUF939 family)
MKKYLLIFVIPLSAIAPAFAFADSSSTIPLPSGFVDNMLARTSSLFSDFSSLTYTIIGIILALLVIGELMNMLRKPNN